MPRPRSASATRTARHFIGCAAIGLFVVGCHGGRGPNTSQDTAAVHASLAKYADLVLRMDHHGIAQLYAADGVLENPGKPIVGPDSIDAFLRGFDAYKVLAYSAVADTTRVDGDMAYQAGRWDQRVRLPSSDTVEVHGRFRAEWARTNEGWRVHSMSATPER